jgi:LPXTG-site transpeptidase (sortase) family protein
VAPRGGSGPGPILSTGMSMNGSGINGTIYSRTVGTNGRMGDPSGAWQIIWYDFSANFPDLGGYPGEPGANAVFAGHVDYIRVGPAVFYNVNNLAPGQQITVHTANGPITYAVQWSATAGPNDDFTQYVAKTGQDVITLVTCTGQFSAGHYNTRKIVRAVRI